jgi:hypothetical protein
VRIPYDEGRASHIGPESCVSRREVWGEAERVNDFETADVSN